MKKHSFKELIQNLALKKFRIVLFLGISAGLPLMLVFSTVKIWLRREGVELETIGYFSWLTIPYSINFLWAPFLDHLYFNKWGRRRTWIYLTQLGLCFSMLFIGFFDPQSGLLSIMICTFLIALFSATQDIAIDAYRREIMTDDEQGIGASLYVYGYRLGMLVSSGFGLWVVDPETLGLSFAQMYQVMGLIMLLLMSVTFFSKEPEKKQIKEKSFIAVVINPFKEFLTRPMAIKMLLFVLFFKLGDGIAGSLYGTFYVDLGYSNKMIAEVTKGVGFLSTMAGLGVGASCMYLWGINRCLLSFGLLQAVSTAAFALLPLIGKSYLSLALIVSFEDFSSGLGTTASVAFISSITNKYYTATQYALLASLAAFGRTFFSGFAGSLVESIGYQNFFLFCSFIALPGLFLAMEMRKLERGQESSST